MSYQGLNSIDTVSHSNIVQSQDNYQIIKQQLYLSTSYLYTHKLYLSISIHVLNIWKQIYYDNHKTGCFFYQAVRQIEI